MKKIILLITAALIASCSDNHAFHNHEIDTDLDLRVELFERCLEKIPSGPTSTTYNDWAEVVDECDSYSVYSSQIRLCKHEYDSLLTNPMRVR